MSKTNLDDGRISKFQRQIYDWLRELYPALDIELEKLMPKNNQRIDIYIEMLNLAIECDGTFHDKPEYFYVKTEEQWKDIVERDKTKEDELYHHGIKLVRIPYKHKLKSSKDLEEFIEQVDYPDIEFNDDIFKYKNDFKNKTLKKNKEYRKSIYQEFSKNNKEYLKEKRKEAYQKQKEWLKENKKP